MTRGRRRRRPASSKTAASGRSSSPAFCAARPTRTAPASSSISCSRSASRRTSRCRCSCSPRARTRRSRRSSRGSRSCPTRPLELPPERDRGESRALGGRVDGHRGPVSDRPGGRWPSASRSLSWGSSSSIRSRRIVERGLRGEGDSALDVLADPTTREVVWFTVWQAVASTLLTLVVALPAAYVLGRYRFRGRSVVSAVVLVPFVLPTVVVALAFLAVLPEPIERGLGADPDRARLLQRRRRRPRRRWVLDEPGPADERGRRDARREPVATLPRDHRAAALSRAGGRRRDRASSSRSPRSASS